MYCCHITSKLPKLTLAFIVSYSASAYLRNQRQFLSPYYYRSPFVNLRKELNCVAQNSIFVRRSLPLSLFQKHCGQYYLPSATFHTQCQQFQKEKRNTNGKSKDNVVPSSAANHIVDDEANLTLIQKFKLMYKRYWYVLIPVHLATSIVWFGSFFFIAKSGVDIGETLAYFGTPEKILGYLRNSDAGYYGIAYAMYKIATPLRYTVTLGGTTLSINYLKNRGHIKPVPTKDELKTMYADKREEFKERTDGMKEKYQEKKSELMNKYQDKTDEMRGKYNEKREEIFDKFDAKKRKKDDDKS